ELDGGVEGDAGSRRVALVELAPGGVGAEHDGVDRLADRVVELAREAAALLVGGLPLGALVEAGVLDRHRGLRRQAGGEVDVLLVPAAPGRGLGGDRARDPGPGAPPPA